MELPATGQAQALASTALAVREKVSLKPFNTFGVDVTASLFVDADSDAAVRQALAEATSRGMPLVVIGGGSNVLLTADIPALVLRLISQGIRIVSEADDRVVIEAEAGVVWHSFVQWTLSQGTCGLENLSLIPGTVGAAPVQNIGAYGVELKDVFHSLVALDRHDGALREFTLEDCVFGYRDSRFKHEPGRWIILRVRFNLSRTPRLHLEYGPVRQRLADMGVGEPTARDVSRAICSIRQEKLPDPAVLGNAGSFFKNPVISASHVESLREDYPDLVGYPQVDGQIKLAAGWLIEQAGWKGFRDGDAGVHRMQSLVLVNYGGASGAQLLALARRIQADVQQRFGVTLEIEPNLY